MVTEIFNQYWWVGIIVAVVIVFIIIVMFVKGKTHKHKWEYVGHIILKKKYLRAIHRCEGCGITIHLPVYTLRQLKEYEEGEKNYE